MTKNEIVVNSIRIMTIQVIRKIDRKANNKYSWMKKMMGKQIIKAIITIMFFFEICGFTNSLYLFMLNIKIDAKPIIISSKSHTSSSIRVFTVTG